MALFVFILLVGVIVNVNVDMFNHLQDIGCEEKNTEKCQSCFFSVVLYNIKDYSTARDR